ncbi:hypothetical protein E4U21_000716 [Claviceps maximensis]|nr:hypothetical protein E4U21_000716 [Claviceps maximensis]
MPLDSRPPPLPPRLPSSGTSSQASASFLASYADNVARVSSDPRTPSIQSPAPCISESGTRRRLLVVYIHGFYGNDQSFQSFPAHVHACLNMLLSNSHAIHSKIYPRYKTYRALEVACNNFSAWLEPHESPNTDVVLVGHSMGGLLAAEIVLLSNRNPHHQHPFKHKILGIIAMDAPFLGLHPGIVISGIASLFQSPPSIEDAQQTPPEKFLGSEFTHVTDSSSSSLTERLPSIDSGAGCMYTETSSPSQPPPELIDPFFDPPFHNDSPFREQPFMKRLINFTSKHRQEGLLNAIGNHINSHFEFGGCLADYRGLHIRYNRLRALEEVRETKLMSDGHPAGSHARVRFVNYYTLSPGRPKPPRQETESAGKPEADMHSPAEIAQGGEGSSQNCHSQEERDHHPACCVKSERSNAYFTEGKACIDESSAVLASLAIQSHDNVDRPNPARTMPSEEADQDTALSGLASTNRSHMQSLDESSTMTQISMQTLATLPLTGEDETDEQSQSTTPATQRTPPSTLDLPAIPGSPAPLILPEPSQFPDKDAKKKAEKEAKRLRKAYEKALENRNKAILQREKLLQKRHKRSLKEAERKIQYQQKEKEQKLRPQNEAKKRVARADDGSACDRPTANKEKEEEDDENDKNEGTKNNKKKKKKLKKFCCLPIEKDGVADETWVEVYMEDMDEVSAHCGLFAPGPHYDALVGDVGARIARWVHGDVA